MRHLIVSCATLFLAQTTFVQLDSIMDHGVYLVRTWIGGDVNEQALLIIPDH